MGVEGGGVGGQACGQSAATAGLEIVEVGGAVGGDGGAGGQDGGGGDREGGEAHDVFSRELERPESCS